MLSVEAGKVEFVIVPAGATCCDRINAVSTPLVSVGLAQRTDTHDEFAARTGGSILDGSVGFILFQKKKRERKEKKRKKERKEERKKDEEEEEEVVCDCKFWTTR